MKAYQRMKHSDDGRLSYIEDTGMCRNKVKEAWEENDRVKWAGYNMAKFDTTIYKCTPEKLAK